MITHQIPQVADCDLFTPTEVAKVLGVCRHTLRNWEKQGKICFQIRKFTGKKVITGKQNKKIWADLY